MKIVLALIMLEFGIYNTEGNYHVENLVVRLSSKGWLAAYEELDKMEEISVPLLTKLMKESRDQNKVACLKRLIEKQSSWLEIEKYPSIGNMPEKYKYPLGIYLKKVEDPTYEMYKSFIPLDLHKVYMRKGNQSEKLATEELVKDLRRAGWTKLQCMTLLYEIKLNEPQYHYYGH